MATSETHRAKPIAAGHSIDNHRRNSAPATNYLAVSQVLRGHITNFVELRRNAVRPASDLQNHCMQRSRSPA
jgi:hypothetical protein